MIIYGSRATQVAKEIANEKCPQCGTQHSTDIHVFQRYAHVFWIPFVPIGKIGASECHHCKQVLREKEMSPGLKKDYQNIRSRAKTPVWTFIGLALVGFAIVYGTFESSKKSARNATLALAPQRGDLLEIKTKSNQYTVYKVEDVQADSVYVRPSQYETNKMSGLAKIEGKEEAAWSEDLAVMSTKHIKTLYDKGTILNIIRK
jgi:hypothetical protein